MPCRMRARDRKVGVQNAKAPVTNAMAVTPKEDHTKLRLKENTHKHTYTLSRLEVNRMQRNVSSSEG